MIDRVRGTLLALELNFALVEVGGIGLHVESDRYSLETLPPLGEEVILFTRFLFVGAQESQPRLFGFATAEGRALFDLLRGVSGIGPSVALRLVGAQPTPGQVAAAVATGDPKAIKVRGVGPKLAKRVILELKDKIQTVIAASGAPLTASGSLPRPVAVTQDSELESAFRALCGLELPPQRARLLLTEIRTVQPEATTEELVRAALIRI